MPRQSRQNKARLNQPQVRVAIYTRRSTNEDNQPFTIEVQESKLAAYVASQDGWTIVARFTDDASGATLDRRGLGQALAAARAGQFDMLLVYRVDRFGRRIRDLVILLEQLDGSGVVFRSATEPFDTCTPVGRMLVHMLGVFAEFERDVMIDRVIDGMEKKASAGQWTLGIAPYGYTVDQTTRRLRQVPDEAAVVREIFNLYTARRIGTRAVANELTRRGYRSRSGRSWSAKTITDILRNPAHAGTISFRDVRAEDAHPPIVDRQTFTAAGALLSDRGANTAGTASDYHLTGKIICPKCGKQYVGTTATGRSRSYRYYTCHTRNRYGTICCDAPRIDADALDDRVLAAISDFYRARTDLITEAITAAHQTYRATRRAVEGELRAISSRIAQRQTAADRYFTDYENGTIDQGILERRIEQIGRELHDLRCHHDQLRLRLDTEPHHLADLDPATVSDHVFDVIAHGTAAVRRSLYEATIHDVRLDLDNAAAAPIFRANITPAPNQHHGT